MPYPINVTAIYPEKLSRAILVLRLFFSPFYVGVPHGICLAVYGIAVVFALIYAWFVVLFTAQYPRGVFDFVLGLERWQARVRSYLYFMTDQYPPFSGKE